MLIREPKRPARGRGTVLVVDDLPANVKLLEQILGAQGYRVETARDGEEALERMTRQPADVVLSDVRMPRRDGFSLCRAIKSREDLRLVPVVLMTGTADGEDRIKAIEAGANDFVTKPIDQQELKARMRSLMQLKQFTDELDSAEAVLRSLALTIEARDPYTEGHCERLARYASAFGQALGLPEEDMAALRRGAYFHDIGKIAIPDAILLKAGPLTAAEFETMKAHPVIGDRLCGDLRSLHQVRPIVRHHHERLDGSGYPDRLVGDAIPLLAQIVGIVDVFDAITTNRPYHAAQSRERAMDELIKDAKRGLRRRDLVDVFVSTLELTPQEV